MSRLFVTPVVALWLVLVLAAAYVGGLSLGYSVGHGWSWTYCTEGRASWPTQDPCPSH
jgi:hypothetical protein